MVNTRYGLDRPQTAVVVEPATRPVRRAVLAYVRFVAAGGARHTSDHPDALTRADRNPWVELAPLAFLDYHAADQHLLACLRDMKPQDVRRYYALVAEYDRTGRMPAAIREGCRA